jgi:hypothetical protein
MSGPNVHATAQIMCTFGMAPSTLNVLPISRVLVEGMPAANVQDHLPLVNIVPFGMCTSVSNPTVAAATTAALGVLTPMPCVPVTATPWLPTAPTTLIGGQPALTADSQCQCAWGGVITIINPGAVRTTTK